MPLCNRNSSADELVPYQVFGFSVLTDDLEAWANRLNVDPNLRTLTRQERAWRILRRSVPAQYKCRSRAVRFPRTSAATCVINGSNNTPEDLARTQDITRSRIFTKLFALEKHLVGFISLADQDGGRRKGKRGYFQIHFSCNWSLCYFAAWGMYDVGRTRR